MAKVERRCRVLGGSVGDEREEPEAPEIVEGQLRVGSLLLAAHHQPQATLGEGTARLCDLGARQFALVERYCLAPWRAR